MGEVIDDLVRFQFFGEESLPKLMNRFQPFSFGQGHDAREHLCGNAHSHDSGILDQSACAARKACGAGQYAVADGPWQFELIEFPPDPTSMAPVKTLRRDQGLERFLEKERIAARPAVDQWGETARHPIIDSKNLFD